MTILDLLRQTTIDPREAELLLAYVLKKDRTYVKAHGQDKVETKVTKAFLSLTQRRQKHEPIAYLTGEQPFFGRDFIVNRHTLIPRPETEILVELVKQWTVTSDQCSDSTLGPLGAHGPRESVVVDVGTGSGCLAVTLALECPDARVIASDVSAAALKVARQNAKLLGAKVEFVRDDLLGKKLISKLEARISKLDSRFDVVFVANLPYLPSTDKKTMMPDVAKYEPSQALFAGRDGSSLVVKLLQQIGHLNLEFGIWNLGNKPTDTPNSKFKIQNSIFLEVDPRQTKKLTVLARQLFPNHEISTKQDLCGRERFLIVTLS
ncbi:MAG: peptide chain release factor N(5)-glutamine methyltransferase [Patescibacteria group bacterium]